MTHRGHPQIVVRLEQEVFDLLKKRVPAVQGRAGGVSLYVRGLIYQDLEIPMPTQYGDLGRSSARRKKPAKKTVAKRRKRATGA